MPLTQNDFNRWGELKEWDPFLWNSQVVFYVCWFGYDRKIKHGENYPNNFNSLIFVSQVSVKTRRCITLFYLNKRLTLNVLFGTLLSNLKRKQRWQTVHGTIQNNVQVVWGFPNTFCGSVPFSLISWTATGRPGGNQRSKSNYLSGKRENRFSSSSQILDLCVLNLVES